MTREQALAAVSGWVERIKASDDPALSLQDDAVSDAAQLARLLDSGPPDNAVLLALGWFAWYQHLAVDGDQDRLAAATQVLAPCFVAGAGPLPEPLLPTLADAAATGAVGSLVAQAAASTDPDLVAAAVALARRVLACTAADHPGRAGRETWLGSALAASFKLSGDPAQLDQSIASFEEAVALCPPGHPDRAFVLANLALALEPRILASARPADVELGIDSLDEALAGTDPSRPDLVGARSRLGGYLHARFGYNDDPADLDQAVAAGRAALAAMPSGYPQRPVIEENLATTLHTRYKRFESPADLEEAIGLYGSALDQAPPDAPERVVLAASLGQLLRLRFERRGSVPDLTAAIVWERTSLRGASGSDAQHAARLVELSTALHLWFEVTGETAGLDEAVAATREAVARTPDADLRASPEDALRVALQDRFEGTRVLADLDEAVAGYRAVIARLPADDPDRGRLLSSLGNALLDRFLAAGDQANLEEALALDRAGLAATPAADGSRALRLSALGITLRTRFGQLGQGPDLDEAITLLRDALAAAPADDYSRPKLLTNLGTALRDRFISTAGQADLDQAIPLLRAAVAAGPADGPNTALFLNNLGAALQLRYSRTGATQDLDEAVVLARRALAATPPGHPRRAWQQNNVGAGLLTRHLRTGSAPDLDEAIDLQRAAAADPGATGETVTRAQYILAAALAERFRQTGSRADLDEAISLGRVVATANQDGQADRVDQLNNLGDALWNRFDRAGSATDLDEAIAVLRDAVALCPPGHTRRAATLTNLGVTLRSRFQRPGGGDPADLAESIRTLAQVAQTATARPSERIRAARTVVNLLGDGDVQRSAGLLAMAVRLLPEVAPRELTARDRQYQLGDDLRLGAGLAADAAALALAAADPRPDGPAQALGLLELGRAVLLTQSLETRSDIGDLATREPALARRFTELRDALDQSEVPGAVPAPAPAPAPGPGLGPGPAPGPAPAAPASLPPAQDRHQLAADFVTLLERIRATPAFSGFLQPPSAAELTRQAGDGPIVVHNVSSFRSDAILVTATGITSIPLPGLRRDVVEGKISEFYTALSQAADGAATAGQRRAAQQTITATLEWLWHAAAEPVLAELGFSQPPAANAPWPRLWWAPGGLLGALPLHAAGTPGSADTVMDRVVSSYTPTIRTLAYARERAARDQARADGDPAASAPTTALVVAMPVTQGLPPLRFVAQEVWNVRQRIPDADVYLESEGAVTDRTPTSERVLALMARAPIAHFACHGRNDPVDPADSQLYLHDHAEHPLTVAALSALNMERAQLAYLSACETALNRNPLLLDEAIHLTAAFQLIGFARVIGTLWPIDDVISASVADLFYAGLRAADGALDLTRSATALHDAQRMARTALADRPSVWAPYLHLGA